MGTVWWKRNWARQLAVVVAYLIIDFSVSPYSDAHLSLTSGLRLAYMLLLPYRYWPALAIADFIRLSEISLECGSLFGVPWAVVNMLPRVALAAPIVWWCRERLGLYPTKRLINFQTLLICTVLVSLVSTLYDMVVIYAAKEPPGHSVPLNIFLPPMIFIGQYIAALAVVPWVLMIRTGYASKAPLRLRLKDFAKQVLAADTLMLVLSAASFFFWLTRHSQDDAQHISLMAVFLPIAWLMLKPGWRAAALGGTPAILCVSWLQKSSPEAGVLQAQGFIALSVTCLLAVGARVAAQRQQEEQDRLDAEQAILLARQNIRLNEIRLRKTAQALELAGSAMHLAHNQLLTRFHTMLPVSEAQRYYRQVAATQSQVNRLAESMHPLAWRERGLPAALHETIARALQEVGILYSCSIKGRGLSELTPDLHAAIYRLACESTVYVNTQMICSRIRLCLRGGVTNSIHWAVLRVEGTVEPSNVNDAVYDISERQLLASKLGTHSFELDTLENYVRLFSGELHARTTSKGIRLSYLLVNESSNSSQGLAAIPSPTQSWVS